MIILFSVSLPVNASGIQIKLNGNYIKSDVSPIVENQRTLVPIRVISESLGYDVNWDQESKTISIFSYSPDKTKLNKSIMLILNEPYLIELNADHLTELAYKMHHGQFDEAESAESVLKTSTFKTLDVSPKAYNNRTMVPLRAISEAFGLHVTWDAKNNTVVIGN